MNGRTKNALTDRDCLAVMVFIFTMLFCMLSVFLYDELAVNRCSSLGYVSMQIQTERYLVIF